MKKSCDYFKMLNTLSQCVNSYFTAILNNKDYESYTVRFSGVQNELSECLRNDFITPIDRGDIFILSRCLYDEYISVLHMYEYRNLFLKEDLLVADKLLKCFDLQNQLLIRFSKEKDLSVLIPFSEENSRYTAGCVKQIQKNIKSVVCGAGAQPLLKYVIYVMFLDIAKCLETFFTETERIIYNNS